MKKKYDNYKQKKTTKLSQTILNVKTLLSTIFQS